MQQVLKPLVTSGGISFQEDVIQRILDCSRENPFWTCAHVAAFLGFHLCLKVDDVKE